MPEGKLDKASGLIFSPYAVVNILTYQLVQWIALDYATARG
jgi:hypothetical protein